MVCWLTSYVFFRYFIVGGLEYSKRSTSSTILPSTNSRQASNDSLHTLLTGLNARITR